MMAVFAFKSFLMLVVPWRQKPTQGYHVGKRVPKGTLGFSIQLSESKFTAASDGLEFI